MQGNGKLSDSICVTDLTSTERVVYRISVIFSLIRTMPEISALCIIQIVPIESCWTWRPLALTTNKASGESPRLQRWRQAAAAAENDQGRKQRWWPSALPCLRPRPAVAGSRGWHAGRRAACDAVVGRPGFNDACVWWTGRHCRQPRTFVGSPLPPELQPLHAGRTHPYEAMPVSFSRSAMPPVIHHPQQQLWPSFKVRTESQHAAASDAWLHVMARIH